MEAVSKSNYYEILELHSNAAQSEVTKAYEKAKFTYSGDNPAIYTIFSAQEARELLVMIEEAYSVLGNKNLRNIYDQRLLSGRASLSDLTYASIVDASKHFYPEPKPQSKKISFKKDDSFEKEITAQERWDGDFLKKVREYKNITVQKMNEITKINSYYINAIESMDVENLPARVFIRGYVIQIARALHLDDKKVADSYMLVLKEHLQN